MTKSKFVTIAAIVAAVALVAGLFGYVYYQRQQVAASANGQVLEVTKDNFEDEVVNSKIPVFVEFYQNGCKPCEAQAPLVEQAAKDYQGKVKFVKIDVDKSPEVAAAVGISVVPTLILANPVTQKVLVAEGYLDAPTLKRFIDTGLDPNPKP